MPERRSGVKQNKTQTPAPPAPSTKPPTVQGETRAVKGPFLFPTLGSFEGRATIEGATVTLKRVTQEDAGEYRCEISAPLDSVSLGETNVTLKVLGTAALTPPAGTSDVFLAGLAPLTLFVALACSAAPHAVLRRPQRRSHGLSGAAAL